MPVVLDGNHRGNVVCFDLLAGFRSSINVFTASSQMTSETSLPVTRYTDQFDKYNNLNDRDEHPSTT